MSFNARSRLLPSLLSILPLLIAAGPASTAHVTDKLVAGVYAEPGTEGSPLRLVSSGTPLEVLSRRDGYAQVRLADDTQGWIDASYVTDEKPAKAILLETQAKLRQMGIELARLREQTDGAGGDRQPLAQTAVDAPPTAREAQLRQSLGKAQARVAELEDELAEVPREQAAKAQLDELRARADQALRVLADAQGVTLSAADDGSAERGLVSRYQDWIIAFAGLVLGFAAGVAFIDYRIRKRYGGFRI